MVHVFNGRNQLRSGMASLETPPCSAKSLKKGFRERSKKGRFEVILEMGGHWEVVLSIPQHLGVRA